MPYSDRLVPLADWWCQLWAESLGKRVERDGGRLSIGQTPVRAIGAADQHSQMQLYLDGPADKVITFVRVADAGVQLEIPRSYPDLVDVAYLGGHELGELLVMEQRAMELALNKRGRPTIAIEMPHPTPFTIGQLVYLMEVETALTASLFGIDPFNQPAVEGETPHLRSRRQAGLRGRAEEIERWLAAKLPRARGVKAMSAATGGRGAEPHRATRPLVADQIAAGEVIERPASVVKELVENALDAGAREIHVTLEDGGRKARLRARRRPRHDARRRAARCLRHATSSRAASRTSTIFASLGFRGEALASIAAAAEVTITTRPRDASSGVRSIVVQGRARDTVCAGARRSGTTIDVRELFATPPARRKFLKTPATEPAHATELLQRLARRPPRGRLHLRTAAARSCATRR